MGQYYRGAILKINHKLAKNPILFALSPYNFGNGAKLMEHSYIGNNYVDAYITMLSESDGIYFGYPFAWVGDYADAVKEKEYYYLAREEEGKSFKEYNGIKKRAKERYYKYFINFSKREYVVMPINGPEKWLINPYPSLNPEKWLMNPLPLLTAYGNGRGCGDYYGKNAKDVGRWAFDKIGFTNDEAHINVPGMKEIKLDFEADF